MMDSSIDLMQYAIRGAGAFILVAVCILALFFKGSAKREARREIKRKKKEAKKEQKQVAKANKKAGKKVSKKASKKAQKKVKRRQKKTSQMVESKPVEIEVKSQEPPRVVEAVSPQQAVRVAQAENLQGQISQVEEVSPQAKGDNECCDDSQSQCSETPIILYFYKVEASQSKASQKFILENYLTIGRNTGYHHWTIEEDMTVSGNHCKIYQRNQELYVLDLNSTNGTYVNDRRVRGEMKLANHDKMRIGQTEYTLAWNEIVIK